MKWIVNWNPDAENDLISWWVSQPNRTEITRVADKIEDLLVKAPLEFSQELVEGLFFLEVFPLIAYFEIFEDEKRIEITALGMMKE